MRAYRILLRFERTLLYTKPERTWSGDPVCVRVSELVSGKSYFRKACVEHNVINAGDDEFVFIDIEMKS